MNRLVIEFNYPDEIEDKLISKITEAVSLQGVKYHTNSFTAPKGTVKVTEVYPKVDVQKAFERDI